MTTTSAAIRDKMVTTLIGLTPTVSSRDKFRLPDDDDGDLRAWAEANPSAAFRRFVVHELGVMRPPEVSDTVQNWTDEDLECVVCYAVADRSRFGGKSYRSLLDVIKSDQKQIEQAIGTNGYQTLDAATGGAAVVTSDDWRLERGRACLFAVLPLRARYWRSMS